MFSNIFNSNSRKTTVVVNLDRNVKLTLVPVDGGEGVDAVLTEVRGVFERREKAYFLELDELVKALKLTDDDLIRKLSKAF